MFIDIKVGDKVYVKTLRKQGRVVQSKKEFCVVQLDEGKEVSPHKWDVVVITEENAEPYNPYQLVKDFHIAFKHPAPDKPTVMDFDTAHNRAKWTIEEVIEHLHATDDVSLSANKNQIMKDVGDMIEKELSKPDVPQSEEERLIAQVDALIDQLYFVYGSLVSQGVRPEELFRIVNNFNMDKLQDGEIVYKDEGRVKVGKRKGWLPPDEEIKKEILRQIKAAENK